MIECDVCLDRPAVMEAIVQSKSGTMLVLSICSNVFCWLESEYTQISNWIMLDNTFTGSVE